MSDLNITTPADVEEMKAFLPVHRRSYLMSPEDGDLWAEKVTLRNARILRRGDRMIGGMQLRPVGQWFGGRSVPMTGISAVGIDPAERAGGAGTTFMRGILHELHAAGVPISTLYPATQTIYRRCGYELAGSYIRYRIDTDQIDVRERTLRIELSSPPDREAVKAIYDTHARRTAGLLDRNEDMWSSRVFDVWKRESDTYLVHGDDGPEGYIIYYRVAAEDVRATMKATFVALTPGATRRILTFIADHRSFIANFDWTGPPADPFTFMLAEPRRTVQLSWPWMLRIVDAERALALRGYPTGVEAELHFRLHDDLIDANDGSFVLNVKDGKGEVTRGGNGRLELDVRGLAPMYSGYLSPQELIATGYVRGPAANLAAAAGVFAGPAPWLADFF